VAFSVAFNKVQEELYLRFFLPFRKYFSWEFDKQKKILDDFVYDIISKRRKDPEIESKNDLLSRYLLIRDQNGQPFSDTYLRDMLINFFIAGRDTTAILLTWTFYYVTANPAVYEELMQEIRNVIGEEEPSMNNIKNLKFLKNVMDEALRLRPPALPSTMKMALDDDILPSGWGVQKGMGVGYNPWTVHRLKSLWGDDAEEFNPKRWEDPNVLKHPFQFLPFQKGPRICLGQDMAYIEAKIMCVLLLQKFKLRLDPKQKVEQLDGIMLSVDNGLKVYVETVSSNIVVPT